MRREHGQGRRRMGIGARLLFVVLLITFCVSAYKLATTLLQAKQEADAFEGLSAIVDQATDPSQVADSDSEEALLKRYQALHATNKDFFGWLSIEGTNIDYPVMYSPDRPEFYLHHAFDGSDSESGVPFLDEGCAPDGHYYLVYGHHLLNQTMFTQLTRYSEQSFYEQQPTLRFDTLTELREYQVVAAFLSQACDEGEQDVFRYYSYTDLSDKAVFEEYMRQVYDEALYDTGVTAEFGDDILVLSTCNYHTTDGRFVVVAKRST